MRGLTLLSLLAFSLSAVSCGYLDNLFELEGYEDNSGQLGPNEESPWDENGAAWDENGRPEDESNADAYRDLGSWVLVVHRDENGEIMRFPDEGTDSVAPSDSAFRDDGYQCPEGMDYATNGDDLAFCLFNDLPLPREAVDPYCHYLNDGYMGFSFPEEPVLASGYDCPEHSRYATNYAGHGFCIFDDLVLPPVDDVQPYCHWVNDGYIGFHWPLNRGDETSYEGPGTGTPTEVDGVCPAGMMHGGFDTSEEICMFFGLPLPDTEVRPYCEDLENAILGFSYRETDETRSTYLCPDGFRMYGAGGSWVYCLFEGFTLPDAQSVEPLCDWIDDGMLGYAWW